MFILVNEDFSKKFSLKNSTKYELKIKVSDNNANVTFGTIEVLLEKGDNFVDLNNNNFADINFNLVKINGKRADVRIINVKNQVKLSLPITVTEKVLPLEEDIEKDETELIEHDEDELKCGNLETLKERVTCRIGLEEEEQEEELEII